MATFTTPDYDRILEAPEGKALRDGQFTCIECDEVSFETEITEVQLELGVCSDGCAYQQIRQIKAALDRETERAGNFQASLKRIDAIYKGGN